MQELTEMINLDKIFVKQIYDIIKNSIVKVVQTPTLKIDKKFAPELYNELIAILDAYTNKITGYPAKYVKKVIDAELIKFSVVEKRQFHNYCVLSINPIDGKPTFYVTIELNIVENVSKDKEEFINKIKDSVIKYVQLNINDIIYSIYQEIIRYSLIKDFSKLKHDKDVFDLTVLIFSGFLLKVFGKKYAPTLTEEKISLTNLLIAYMIYTYYLKFDPRDALKIVIEHYQDNPKYKDVIDSFKEKAQQIKIQNYTDIKHLGTLLDEFGIVNVPGTKFTFILINEIGTKTLLDLFASYPSLISNFVIVRYPVDYISKKLLVGELNKKLEDTVVKNYM